MAWRQAGPVVNTTGRATLLVLVALAASAVGAQSRVTLDQAAAVLSTLSSNLPPGLAGLSPEERARAWSTWVDRHDRDVRARLARGDDDSLVNFWLYGTSFTSHPPAIGRAAAMPSATLEDLARRRLDDLLDRVTSPDADERLQFARRVLASRSADPATADGGQRARRFLLETRQRMIAEFAGAERELAAARTRGDGALSGANATIFRDRGISSDTSLLADYGVFVALETIARQRTLAPGSVRRVAVVGPGLDFTNKADGYDFYPQQTLQPFAIVDALRRTGLAAADLRVTTLDINQRVNDHVRNATARATTKPGYVVTLPLDGSERWTSEVLAYWQRWGSAVGTEVPALAPPAVAGLVRTRAVRLDPVVVASVEPRDFNVVVDRLPLPQGERFDLIVATNVLVYYGVFEQALAAANIAAMLEPGGVFVTNTAVVPTAPLRSEAAYLRVAHTTERYDELFWYRRD